MSISPSQRGQLAKKLSGLAATRLKAEEALYVGIYEAHEAGLSYDDIAHQIGDKSGSGIPAKARRGKAILDRSGR
jgi:hypothetical protein